MKISCWHHDIPPPQIYENSSPLRRTVLFSIMAAPFLRGTKLTAVPWCHLMVTWCSPFSSSLQNVLNICSVCKPGSACYNYSDSLKQPFLFALIFVTLTVRRGKASYLLERGTFELVWLFPLVMFLAVSLTVFLCPCVCCHTGCLPVCGQSTYWRSCALLAASHVGASGPTVRDTKSDHLVKMAAAPSPAPLKNHIVFPPVPGIKSVGRHLNILYLSCSTNNLLLSGFCIQWVLPESRILWQVAKWRFSNFAISTEKKSLLCQFLSIVHGWWYF